VSGPAARLRKLSQGNRNFEDFFAFAIFCTGHKKIKGAKVKVMGMIQIMISSKSNLTEKYRNGYYAKNPKHSSRFRGLHRLDFRRITAQQTQVHLRLS
jgi:hypothetical protein